MNSESVSEQTSLVSCAGENIPPERLSVLLKDDWVSTAGTKHLVCFFFFVVVVGTGPASWIWISFEVWVVVHASSVHACIWLLRFVEQRVCNLVPTWRVGKQKERLESFTDTRSPYIFNLLGFTYCLNDSCNFNESLSATETATIIPALQIVLAALAGCLMLVASFISPNSLLPLPCWKPGFEQRRSCIGAGAVSRLGAPWFYGRRRSASRKGIKDAGGLKEGWATVVADQRHFTGKLKWKIDVAYWCPR